MRTNPTNPIVAATAKLMLKIRNSDAETCQQAVYELESFANSWLVSGEGSDLKGAGNCCFSDADVANGVINILSDRL